jgi:hypothetical protein
LNPVEAVAELAGGVAHHAAPLRRQLTDGIAASSGLHPTSVERLTTLWAEAWRAPGPQRLVRQMSAGFPVGRVAVVAPGNLCVATWSAIAEPLVAGNVVRVRPGSGDPLAAERWRAALAELSPEVAQRIEIDAFGRGDLGRWRHFLQDVDALVVYGGDAAVAALWQIAGEAGFAGRLRGHGDRRALSVLHHPDELLAQASQLAHDALLADGRGCLSLRTVWLVGDWSRAVWQSLHAALAQALHDGAHSLPAGQLSAQVRAACAASEAGHAFAAALGRCWLHRSPDAWLATYPSPDGAVWGNVGRGLVLAGVPDEALLGQWLKPWRGRLSAMAGSPGPALLQALAVPKVCAPGQLQAPRAEAGLDGQPPLAGLWSCTTVATASGGGTSADPASVA